MRRAMRYAVLMLGLMPLLACQDFAGLEELDRASAEVVRQAMVDRVECTFPVQPDTLPVGEVMSCRALNRDRTVLTFGGLPLIVGGWTSRGPQIASVTLDGQVTGMSPGTIWIIAEGTLNTRDSVRVVVPAP